MKQNGKIELALDADLVAQTREALGDPNAPDAAVVERALNAYLLRRLMGRVQAASGLEPDEADRIAVEETRAARRARRGA
jgi:hypothetical protein